MTFEGIAVCQHKIFHKFIMVEYFLLERSQLLQLYDQDMAIKFLEW